MYLYKSAIHFAFLLDNNWAGYTSRRGPAGIFIRFSTGVLVKQDSETNKNLVKQSPMLPLLTGTRCLFLISFSPLALILDFYHLWPATSAKSKLLAW